MQQSIEVRLYMEKGMYGRLVERAKDLGAPLSAVVRDAVVKYFDEIPEVPDREQFMSQPDDPIWQLPQLSQSYGALSVPNTGQGGELMPRLIFVNTSGWLALYNPNDPNHGAASALWEDLRGQPVHLVTTDYVMDQVYTALKVFGSLHAAQAFHQLVNNSQIIRLFMTDSVIFERAWELFVEDEQPHWTYTDCVNYAVIQYLGVDEVITFDPSFSAPGMKLLPGEPA